MKKRQETMAAIMEKATEDSAFRSALLADAKAAVAAEFGVTLRDGVNYVVHENTADTIHLPLPAKPRVLSEGELASVSGGLTACSCGCGCSCAINN